MIRLALAILVLYSHCFPLATGNCDREPLYLLTHLNTLGGIAVSGFFVISGYLISFSWLTSKSTKEFIVKRVLRIYPGYWVAYLLSIAAGMLSAGENSFHYLQILYSRSDAVMQSIVFLDFGAFNNYTCFPNNPIQKAVNGSIWSLKPEVECYWLVALLGLAGMLRRRSVIVALFGISYAMYASQILHLQNDALKWRLWTHFLFGVMMAHRRGVPSGRDMNLTFIALVALFASLINTVAFNLALPVFGSYAILNLCRLPVNLGCNFFARFDLSYGVYLYAWPIQQLLIQFCDVRDPVVLLAYSLPTTLLLAWLSWICIERPALGLRGRLLGDSGNDQPEPTPADAAVVQKDQTRSAVTQLLR